MEYDPDFSLKLDNAYTHDCHCTLLIAETESMLYCHQSLAVLTLWVHRV